MGNIIKDINEQDRPYEKCLRVGPEALSDAELLAVIIRSGTTGHSAVELAMEVLKASNKEQGILGIIDMTIPELKKIKGIGGVKAVQLKCIGELAMRISRSYKGHKEHFNSPAQISGYYMEKLRHERREQLVLLMLDTKGGLVHETVLSKGTVDFSIVSPRDVFVEALRYDAVKIVLVHNHPSGDPEPSGADISITDRIEKLGNIIGIPLIDHIIIGDNTYVSFKERRLIR